MTKNKTIYLIVSKTKLNSVMSLINDLKQDGWKLYGNTTKEGKFYSQVMVLPAYEVQPE